MSFIYKCDRCGCIEDSEDKMHVITYTEDTFNDYFHLCKDCYGDFSKFADGYKVKPVGDLSVDDRYHVEKTYNLLVSIFFDEEATIEDCYHAIEEAMGYLGEVLD